MWGIITYNFSGDCIEYDNDQNVTILKIDMFCHMESLSDKYNMCWFCVFFVEDAFVSVFSLKDQV
jgi:hypothetical protein